MLIRYAKNIREKLSKLQRKSNHYRAFLIKAHIEAGDYAQHVCDTAQWAHFQKLSAAGESSRHSITIDTIENRLAAVRHFLENPTTGLKC